MKLVVIIPALNEEVTISRVIKGIPSSVEGIKEIQAIVIDDGSSDRTAELAREAGALCISHGVNRGVGVAFKTGVEAALKAGADVIVNMDGDGQFDPANIPELIQPIIAGQADFVTCSRFASKELRPDMSYIKFLGNRWMTTIINLVTGKKFTDVSCGFRAYSRETALKLNLFGTFTYTQETFIDLVRKEVRIKEVPLPVRGTREFGESRVASNVMRYGIKAGSIIMLTLRDSRPLIFFGIIGVVIFSMGVLSGGFVFLHWLDTHMTTPYHSMVTLSSVLLILGFLLMIMALIADMLGRLRKNQDEMLYLQRKEIHDLLRKNNRD